ncbi:MAG: ribonuclease III [Ruminococcaceae bacterium]|nr:ribonuclease III [Oscillospiraceae bacterium]
MNRLEEAIGYRFRDITLLQNALSHSSFANERFHNSLKSNERLEFLGDSVLGMVVAEHLYRTCPDRPEGELSRSRADMVCENSLAVIARKLGLGEYLLLGHGEAISGGKNRPSILADAVESVIAAIYLDGGFAPAKEFIHKFVLTTVTAEKPRNMDYKTAFQELIQQKKGQTITYELIRESGPDHNKEFVVQVCVNGNSVGEGIGSSKKRAEQDAARNALEKLQ